MQSVGPSEYRRRLAAMVALFPADQSIAFTATTAASTSQTAVSSFAGLQIGMTLHGSGFLAGQTIVAMTESSSTLTTSAAATDSVVGEHITASFSSGSAEVHLFKTAYAGGADPTPADFTEADFDTYAAQDITTGFGPYTTGTGGSEIDFGDIGWVLTATPMVGNTVYGYWVDYLFPYPGGTRVVSCWESFSTPISMLAAGNAIVLSVPINLPTPGSASLV